LLESLALAGHGFDDRVRIAPARHVTNLLRQSCQQPCSLRVQRDLRIIEFPQDRLEGFPQFDHLELSR
jgi:hypothetical protein